MEKKSTQRIIGILVVLALVIILLPFLVDKNEPVAMQTSSVKAPPFPDQANQSTPTPLATTDQQATQSTPPVPGAQPATAADSATSHTENVIEITPEVANKINALSAPAQQTAPEANKQPQAPAAPTLTPTAATVNPVQQTPPATTLTPEQVAATEDTAEPVDMKPTVIATPKPQKIRLLKTTSIKEKHVKTAHQTSKAIKLNKGWVVQMGSFKDKSNARHLADRLRTAGYKAFMHDVRSRNAGVQTRVYIGPEAKQASAAKLSTKLAERMKLRGFLVEYKPLEL